VCALLLLGGAHHEREVAWERTDGPEGGYADGLMAMPDGVVFAGVAAGGVYRRDPSTRRWSAVGLAGDYVYFLAHSDGSIYAAGEANGLMRSDDGGHTWLPTSMRNGSISVDGDRVYVASSRLDRSYDRGGTSESLHDRMPIGRVVSAVGARGDTVFVATRDGASRSLDGGDTWQETTLVARSVRSWAFTNGAVYAHGLDRLHRSPDNGATWEEMPVSGYSAYGDHTLWARGDTVYVAAWDGIQGTAGDGVFVSNDDGDSWTRLTLNGLGRLSVRAVARVDGAVFASSLGDGVYRLDDGASSWTLDREGMTAAGTRDLATLGSMLFAATDTDPAVRTRDRGDTWEVATTGMTEGAGGDEIISAEGALYVTADPEAYRSLDAGKTWQPLGIQDPQGLASGGGWLYAFVNRGVHRSADGGDTWTFRGLTFDPRHTAATGDFVLASVNAFQFYSSGDAGDTWTETRMSGASVAPTAAANGVMYIGGWSDWRRSTDGGDTWDTIRGPGTSGTRDIFIAGDAVYATTRSGVVYRSFDRGDTWDHFSALPGGRYIATSVAVGGDTVYVGTFGSGVFRAALPPRRFHTTTTLAPGLTLIGPTHEAKRIFVGRNREILIGEAGLHAADLIQAGATLCVRMRDGDFDTVVGRDRAVLFGADFRILPGEAYIVNLPETTVWEVQGTAFAAADSTAPTAVWAFGVAGCVSDVPALPAGSRVVASSPRAGWSRDLPIAPDGSFSGAVVSMARVGIVDVGDRLELEIVGPDGVSLVQAASQTVVSDSLGEAFLSAEMTARIESGRLLPMYPNPANPEVWIPFQLAEASDVQFCVYDAAGRAVRHLALGMQPPGYYVGRAAAAHWDGRNESGERASSGVYFVEFRAGHVRAMRRIALGR